MNDFLLNLGLPDVIGRDLAWPALGWTLAREGGPHGEV